MSLAPIPPEFDRPVLEVPPEDHRERRTGPSQATLILTALKETEGVELFHTSDAEAFASFIVDAARQTWPIRSKSFRTWLARAFYNRHGRAAGSQAVEDALRVIEAKAEFEGPERPVFCRVGQAGDAVYLDLGDARWRAVRVTSEGWTVETTPAVRFRRCAGMGALPEPQRGGTLADLRPFVNIGDEDDFRLMLAFLVAAMRPKGPYPTAILQGEQGTAKSTTAKVMRALVDPSTAPLRSAPREERDLVISARNGWLLNFDNLSGIPNWLSDAICRLATGGGLTTRALYTDAEEMIFNAQRPIIVNGIDDLATRDDLRDRSLIFTLPAIRSEDRQEERTFWESFEQARPGILGAMLEALSGALSRLPDVDVQGMPRMADFATLGIAMEQALEWTPGSFLSTYEGNREEAISAGLEAEPLAQALQDWLGESQLKQATAAELLADLADHADDEIRRSPAWPKGPRALSNRLKRMAPMLRTVGIEIRRSREGHDRQRVITIERAGKRPSASSASAAS